VPTPPQNICILVTVYHPYRWIAPFLLELLGRFWPGHPPVFFCGLTSDEAGDLPHIPCRQAELPRSWAAFTLDACRALAERGYDRCYVIGEDHVPLGDCHVGHLHETLPDWMDALPASYIGMMGWDNRRYIRRGTFLSPDRSGLLHLDHPESPRFHLHPSLFRLPALISCLELLVTREKQTPWAFEKACDKPGAAIPDEWKASCYQICGERMSLHPPGPAAKAARRVGHWFYHRMMSFFPPLRRIGLGMAFWDLLGYDNFFQDGPYPMFYSGVMARGRLNPFFVRYVKTHFPGDECLSRLIECAASQ
jgi:hypothetical protein